MTTEKLGDLIQCIRSSNNIIAIIGAGLSRPSGIPTFRQDGASWRGRPSSDMARPATFAQDPIAVWTFYENRRQMALAARPNAGHAALAALAEATPNFLAITQNIDDLSQRAGHRMSSLVPIHGSLFAIQCADNHCDFTSTNHDPQPTVAGLVLPPSDVSDPSIPVPVVSKQAIPHCPRCGSGILRPGVTWFGESLPIESMDRIDQWLDAAGEVDLVMLIGTSRTPFLHDALARGARMACFNVERDFDGEVEDEDWFVEGDAACTLPYVIGRALERQL